jgi:hypothetical protein
LPPINVASGTGTRIVDLARRIARLSPAPARIKLLPAPDVGATRFVANVERMRQLLRIDPPLDPMAFLERLYPAAALNGHASQALALATSPVLIDR